MRIALIVPGVGGVQRAGHQRVIPVIQALIERLARRHEVPVVALDDERQIRYSLLGAPLSHWELWKASRRAAGGWPGCDVSFQRCGGRASGLTCCTPSGPATTRLGAIVAGRLLRSTVIVSIGGGELVWLPDISYGGQGGLLGRTKISMILRMADAVSACSQYSLGPLRAFARTRFGSPGVLIGGCFFDGPTARTPGHLGG